MILVFGKNGQVARALELTVPNAVFLSSKEANFLDLPSVIQALETHKPTIVINAAAYTAVDKAEDDRDASEKINAVAPGEIAQWCSKNHSILIHFSTDYVFSGEGETPWNEDSNVNPVNWYGETKLAGDLLIQRSGCRYFIFRVSWVYSDWGTNFPKTILRLAREREQLKVINDQWGAPTAAIDIAKTVGNLVKKLKINDAPPSGVFHLRFEDYQTWFDFAVRTIDQARKNGEILKVKEILPIPSEDYPTRAKRPKNSRLSSKYPKNLFD